MQASLLFMAKLQSVLSANASQCNSSESCTFLATASCNLGLEPSRYESLDSTPSCASDVRMLRSLSHRIQRSLDSSSVLLGASRPPSSSPAFTSSARGRTDAPLQLEDLDSSSERMPARRQLFAVGTEESTQGERSLTLLHSQGQVEVTSSYPLEPSAMYSPQQTGLFPSSRTGQDGTFSHEVPTDLGAVNTADMTHDYLDESFDLPVNSESDHPILEPPYHFSLHSLQLQHSVSDDLASPPLHRLGNGYPFDFSLQPIDLAAGDLLVPRPLQRLCHSVRYMKLFPCSKAFSTWRKYAGRRMATRERGQLMEGRRRTREMKRAFHVWKKLGMKRSHLRELEAGFVRRTEDCVLRASFKTWKKAVRQQTSNKEAGLVAVKFSDTSCLRRHWLQWREVFKAKMEDNDKVSHSC